MHDFLIAGGGVSGLSLAVHLGRAFPSASILVVDRNLHDLDERNLSYWSRRPTLFDGAARGSWDRLAVRTTTFERRLALGEYRYRSLRGADFVAAARARLATSPSIAVIEGNVTSLVDGAAHGRMRWDGGEAQGKWIFDGRLLGDDARPHPGSVLVRQHFLGWEIETDTDSFDPSAPTFLDFRASQMDAVRFFYVLPFSSRHALVELVVHGVEPAEAQLEDYLRAACGVLAFRRLAVESGASPLTDHVHPRRLGQRLMSIGVHGGRLKASTGYAFTRIQRDSEAIVRSLQLHNHPFAIPRERFIPRFLDSILLRVMQSRPAAVERAFEALFKRHPIERVLRFLDDDATLWETLLIVLRMPAGAFLTELARMALGRQSPSKQLPRTYDS